ncbi:MAG: NAD-dependent epimerase/dehydratase family protein [Planctomycetes bacterium]|nr:NAD-dependent epimerase/dehydratase family protein [Planctomycetota bacterium]
MNVLVTGGAGFIGSHVAEAFLAEGARVTVIDDLSNGCQAQVPRGAAFARLGVETAEAAALVKGGGFDLVAHLAGQVEVRRSFEDPRRDATVNVLGTINLLQAMAPGSRMIFMSTVAVYGDADQRPTTEEAPCRPLSPYGIGKLAAERYVEALARSRGLSATIFRCSNVFGARQNPHGDGGAVAIFTRRLIAGLRPQVFGDGLHLRDYVHVGDVARAFLLAARLRSGGLFNLGLGQGTTTLDILGWIRAAVGPAAPVPEHVAERPGDVRASVLSSERFERAAGWKPRRDLRALIPDVVRWYQAEADAPPSPGAPGRPGAP